MVGVAEGATRPRLDAFVLDQGLAFTRSQIKKLIDEGAVEVNGSPAKAGARLRTGDDVQLRLRPPEPSVAVPQDIALDVLFEDRHLIVVDKPAGLVVHPAPGHRDGTLVNALLHHCDDLSGIGGQLRPGIVHRLDKDTSGVMIASKDDVTHSALAALFAHKQLVREYVAVVAPPPAQLAGTFATLHGRHPTDRKRFSSRVARGKPATTHWQVLEQFGPLAALVRCQLETGRTHQIRVHFADHGAPLVGDPLYGRRLKGHPVRPLAEALGRQALHAARLELIHPITGQPLSFTTPPPADMQTLLDALRVLQPAP